MPRFARELAALPVETAWLDAEVVMLGDGGIPNFNALQIAFDTRGIVGGRVAVATASR